MKSPAKKAPTQRKPWSGTRAVELNLHLPAQFVMLCELLEVSPEQAITDFLQTAGMESYGPGKVHQVLLTEYLLRCGYGQHHYTPEEVRQMLEELRSVGSLWPDNAPPEVTEAHGKWREMYHEYWFKKWYGKIRRQLASTS